MNCSNGRRELPFTTVFCFVLFFNIHENDSWIPNWIIKKNPDIAVLALVASPPLSLSDKWEEEFSSSAYWQEFLGWRWRKPEMGRQAWGNEANINYSKSLWEAVKELPALSFSPSPPLPFLSLTRALGVDLVCSRPWGLTTSIWKIH